MSVLTLREDRQIPDLATVREGAAAGAVRMRECDGLIVACYSRTAFIGKHGPWTDISRNIRGLVFEADSGEVVAFGLQKFFNLGETAETQIRTLPEGPVVAEEKVDGTLFIVRQYRDQLVIATKAELRGPYVDWARDVLADSNAGIVVRARPDLALVFEGVMPGSAIDGGQPHIVDYGERQDLTLLAAYDVQARQGLSIQELDELAARFGVRRPERVTFGCLQEAIDRVDEMTRLEEGYVLRYPGVRVKLKSPAWLLAFRAVSDATPLLAWEAIDEDGRIERDILSFVPEHIRDDYLTLIHRLEDQYWLLSSFIVSIAEAHAGLEIDRDVAASIKAQAGEFAPLVFACIRGSRSSVHSGILRRIRPTENRLVSISVPDVQASPARGRIRP